jgi:acetyltransferase-like isoleucine patch superfamily enzyme
MRDLLKRLARIAALILAVPALASFWVRARILGRDRALEGSSQALALLPGIPGQYLRNAFLSQVLAGCHSTATISFLTLFSQAGARIDERVYVGPGCSLGLVHIERDALLGSSVHVTSGSRTHGTEDTQLPIREQPMARHLVRIGEGAWIGSGAIVMADVGRHTVVGAGSVVTRPLPDHVVAAGAPAKIIRQRDTAAPGTLRA